MSSSSGSSLSIELPHDEVSIAPDEGNSAPLTTPSATAPITSSHSSQQHHVFTTSSEPPRDNAQGLPKNIVVLKIRPLSTAPSTEAFDTPPSSCHSTPTAHEGRTTYSRFREQHHPERGGKVCAHRDAPSEIIPGFLFLGSQRAANSKDRMAEYGITRYLCCAAEAPLPSHVEPERLQSGDVEIKHIPMRDGAKTQLQEHFNEAFAFIQAAKRARRRVLVYCREGKSRSASIIIAYFIRYMGMSYEEALAAVRTKRSVVDPNFSFCNQLDDYSRIQIVSCSPRSDGSSPMIGFSPAGHGDLSSSTDISPACPALLNLHIPKASNRRRQSISSSEAVSPKGGRSLPGESVGLQAPTAILGNRAAQDEGWEEGEDDDDDDDDIDVDDVLSPCTATALAANAPSSPTSDSLT